MLENYFNYFDWHRRENNNTRRWRWRWQRRCLMLDKCLKSFRVVYLFHLAADTSGSGGTMPQPLCAQQLMRKVVVSMQLDPLWKICLAKHLHVTHIITHLPLARRWENISPHLGCGYVDNQMAFVQRQTHHRFNQRHTRRRTPFRSHSHSLSGRCF